MVSSTDANSGFILIMLVQRVSSERAFWESSVLYHGRWTVSVCDTIRQRARVVGIPRWCSAWGARITCKVGRGIIVGLCYGVGIVWVWIRRRSEYLRGQKFAHTTA